MLNLKSEAIKTCVSGLADNVRAENIEYESYIKLYSGTENILNINNRNNTIIYGRRGSGKTHLLKALQEKIAIDLYSNKNFPIYIDIRRIVPLLSSEQGSQEINSILIFKYLMQELAHTLILNINHICGINEFDSVNDQVLKLKELDLLDKFKSIYLEFDGRKFVKPTSLTVSEEEIKSLGGSAKISRNPELSAKKDLQTKVSGDKKMNSYISILDITNEIENILESLSLRRITLIIDEWSEIEMSTQIYLAEILKKSFSAIPVTLKIAAIPNRTNLGIKTEEKFFGLEDGGDIFGYPLDMRYVFEVNKSETRNFFNDLIYKHLYSIDPSSIDGLLKDNKTEKDKIINLFFANVAMNEILVASAGIPRDFMNLFIDSYDKFLLSSGPSSKRISVKNLRSANSEWYETDKKEQIDKHPIERQLLTEIVKEVIENKKSIHFLVQEKHTKNKHMQNLIDFRVMHLRKKGYSHKDHSGTSYNVFSIDYGCYNSLNISKNKLDASTLENLNLKELREIRRISLEDSFFQKFLMEIGEAFSCPHCNRPIDTNHLAYIKQRLCNNCYEKIQG
ncbi:ORC-CDC6 family AAA ATPase [Vibrio sp. V23_P3S9T160]|uniref:ORC-CDC6 family AAA ATPase n=1 Tax=Vibrio sp. V23_P3S9T160 TaxID=1938675 RepID=UPI001372C4CA|nr:ATP-binding protein [Vibrio sp. V23_P3S9T160]NAW97695.1 ATP-binding protein [Vibrio sp. V23_P3S9T160]